jgi:hypothetical protein
MIGSSDGREEARRVKHVVSATKRAERTGLRGQEGGSGRDLIRDRREQGPGSEPSVEQPGRNGRCCRLPRAPSSRAGARAAGYGVRIGRAGQVEHQGLDQRGEMPPTVLGSDEMRATRLCGRGHKHSKRQERCNGSRRRERQIPGRTRSRHSSGSVDRFPLPPRKGKDAWERGAARYRTSESSVGTMSSQVGYHFCEPRWDAIENKSGRRPEEVGLPEALQRVRPRNKLFDKITSHPIAPRG